MKAPGIGEKSVQIRVLGSPPQQLEGSVSATHQLRRISRPTFGHSFGNRMPGYSTGRIDDLSHRVAVSRPEIAGQDPSASLNPGESSEVGIGQIDDMDIIANAGAIGRRVIVTKNSDRITLPQRNLHQKRNQMRFGLVIFP